MQPRLPSCDQAPADNLNIDVITRHELFFSLFYFANSVQVFSFFAFAGIE